MNEFEDVGFILSLLMVFNRGILDLMIDKSW